MWEKTSSATKPDITDTTSSRVYNYFRRNIVLKKGEDGDLYEYDEIKVPKTEWATFNQTMANTATIDYIAMMANVDI